MHVVARPSALVAAARMRPRGAASRQQIASAHQTCSRIRTAFTSGRSCGVGEYVKCQKGDEQLPASENSTPVTRESDTRIIVAFGYPGRLVVCDRSEHALACA